VVHDDTSRRAGGQRGDASEHGGDVGVKHHAVGRWERTRWPSDTTAREITDARRSIAQHLEVLGGRLVRRRRAAEEPDVAHVEAGAPEAGRERARDDLAARSCMR
jgi:hypothetical protein